MKPSSSLINIEILTFSVAAIALSSLICYASYDLGQPNLAILSVFTPTLIAFFLTLISHGKKGIHELFVLQTTRKISLKWLLVSLAGIPILAFFAQLAAGSIFNGPSGLRTTQLIPQIVVIVLIALGEEYGWRGFLLPRLMKKFSVFNSSLILGLIWGFWHFPAYLIGTGVPKEMNFTVFLLWVILGTLFISWIYFYTRSVLTSILAHIGANAAFNYFWILPEFTGGMTTFWVFIGYLFAVMTVVYLTRKIELVRYYLPSEKPLTF